MNSNAQKTGGRLKEERERLGWSQQQAANAVGIRREMWAKYEAGAEPGAKALSAMAQFGVDILYVLTGSRSFLPPPSITPEHRALIADYDACLPNDQAALRRTAAAMALGRDEGIRVGKVRKADIYVERAGAVVKKLKQRDAKINIKGDKK